MRLAPKFLLATAISCGFLVSSLQSAQARPDGQGWKKPSIAATASARNPLPNHFPRPRELEPAIQFWIDVFTRYTENQFLIHDRHRPERILDVVDLTKLSKRGLSKKALYRAQKKEQRAAVEDIKKLLGKMHKARNPASISSKAAAIHAMYKRDSDPDKYKKLAEGLRVQRGVREKFRDSLVLSGRYLPHIERIFREAGMPKELTRLPFIESSFRREIVSHAGAAGVWQFMPATAKNYMRYDHVADERLDPLFATEAAVKHLTDDFAMLGRWDLATTAYNYGRAGIRRALKQIDGKTLVDMRERFKGRRFGFASRNFYVELIAAVEVEKNADKYFGKLQRKAPIEFDEVTTNAWINYDTFADISGTNVGTLRWLNPGLSDAVINGDLLIPKGYRLRIERGERSRYNKALAALPASKKHSGQRSYYAVHKVRKGQTLSGIARRYGTSTTKLRSLNRIKRSGHIRIGQRLKVPTKGNKNRRSTAVASKPIQHRVKRGETLSSIAKRHGSSVSAIMSVNGIRNAKSLQAGQRLTIPRGRGNTKRSSPRYVKHKVRSGQTVLSIARKYGTTISAIKRANGLNSKARINAGQTLKIPRS